MSLEATWVTINNKDPLLARSSHKVSVVPNPSSPGEYGAYTFGGEHIARHAIDNKIHMMRLTETSTVGTWREVETTGNPPCERFAHGQTVIGNRIYVHGGRQGVTMDEKALDDMHYFDTTTHEWSEVTYHGGNPPSKRSFHVMCAIGTTLYVFGGCDDHHGRCSDLYSFDTKTGIWSTHPSSPAIAGRGGATFEPSADGLRLFVMLGFSGQENNDVHIFDLATESWTQVENPGLRPRSVCTSASLPLGGGAGVVVVFGGEVDISAKGHEGAGEFENDVIVIDGATGKLREITSIGSRPTARGWATGAALGNSSLLMFGGLSGSDANPVRLNDVQRLVLVEKKKKVFPWSLALAVGVGIAGVAFIMSRR